MFSYCDKRSHLEFKVCLKQSGLSIKLRGKISRAWNSVIRILTAICTKHKYNMQPRKLRMAYLVFLIIFLLQRQRALLLQQFCHFLVAEEEFRVRRRNRQYCINTSFQTSFRISNQDSYFNMDDPKQKSIFSAGSRPWDKGGGEASHTDP